MQVKIKYNYIGSDKKLMRKFKAENLNSGNNESCKNDNSLMRFKNLKEFNFFISKMIYKNPLIINNQEFKVINHYLSLGSPTILILDIHDSPPMSYDDLGWVDPESTI